MVLAGLMTLGNLMLGPMDEALLVSGAYANPNNDPPPPCEEGQSESACGCLSEGETCCDDGSVVSDGEECCPVDGSGGGGSGATSLKMQFFLGKDRKPGINAGMLLIKSEFPEPALCRPERLKLYTMFSKTEALYDGQALRQAVAAQTFLDVVTLNAFEYELRFYPLDAINGYSNGYYAIDAQVSPFAVWNVKNPDGTNSFNRLFVSKWVNGEQTESHNFTWNDATRSWTLVKGNESEVLYTADILANGNSPQSANIPGGASLFPSTAVDTNANAVSPFGFSAVLPSGNYTVSIQTPFGNYLTGPKALPGSGHGTNADYLVLAELAESGQPGAVARKEIKIWQDAGGHVAKIEHRLQDLTFWGSERKLPVLEILDPDGAALITSRTYYHDPYESFRHGKLNLEVKPDGSWKWFDYDRHGRKTVQMESWLDQGHPSQGIPDAGQVTATYYSYESIDALDVPSIRHYRPRKIEKRIMGQVVEKTFHAYFLDSEGALVHVEEKAATPGAAYGDEGNLRTVTVEYDDDRFGLLASLPKSRQMPDGSLDSYSYELGSYQSDEGQPGAFSTGVGSNFIRQVITHGTVTSPEGIAFKTTREIKILNEFRNPLLKETYVKTPTGYERVDWTVHEYDPFQRETKTYQANGLFKDVTWQTCCATSDEIGYDGLRVTKVSDQNRRLLMETFKGVAAGEYPAQEDLATSYTYDGAGNKLTKIVTAGGLSLITASNQYDLAGRLIKTVNEAGLETAYSYATGGRITTVIRPGGASEVTEKYADGRPKSITGEGTTARYSEYGVNADGSQWTKVYTGSSATNSPAWQKTTTDLLGRLVRVEKPGFGGTVETNRYEYNEKGQLVRTSASGQADTLYVYDELGRQIRSGLDLNSNGALDLASLDRIKGSEFAYVLRNGSWWEEVVSIAYAVANDSSPTTLGAQRRKLSGSQCGCAAGEKESVDIHGNITSVKVSVDASTKSVTTLASQPDSTQTVTQVNVNGRLMSATSKTGLELTFAYDALGRQIAAIDPRTGTNGTHYSAQGRIDYTEDAAGNRTAYTYDANSGRRIAVTDALSNTTHTAYDLQGRVLATWGAAYPVAYDYDDYGRMTAMYTYRGANEFSSYAQIENSKSQMDRTDWKYDISTGLLTNKLYADEKGTAYTYDNAGRLISRTWARGVITDYYYDLLGLLTNISYSDSTPVVAFTYDRLGRQATITDVLGTRTNAYDSTTLSLAEEQMPDGSTLYRNEDSFGRPSGLSIGNYAVSYGYDSFGRFSSVSSSVPFVANYSYLTNSDLLSGYTNNHGISVARVYEADRNLIASIQNRASGALISQFDYENDAVGRRTKRTDIGSTTNTFGYNIRSELIEAVMGTNNLAYQYDQIGNREWTRMNANTNSYWVNELNQYSAISNHQTQIASTPTYDNDGNMTSYNGWSFSWDAENRLIVASNGSLVLENTYDYMSRRVQKTVGSTTHHYLYDAWNMIAEKTTHDSLLTTNYFLWGLDLSGALQGAGGVGGLLATIRSGVKDFYLYDANGNVTDLVDTNGTIVAHYEYDPYGNEILRTGSEAQSNPYRFSSKYMDEETGLRYYGFRFYNPELGRWLSRDPIAEEAFIRVRSAIGVEVYDFSRFVSLPLDDFIQNETFAVREESQASALELRNQANVGSMDRTGVIFVGLKTVDGGTLYNFVLNDPQNVVDGLGDIPFISFGVSGCLISFCGGSGCLGSVCGASGCFGSGCVGSACLGSACGGSSVCAGSICTSSGCVGSGCGGSACGGSGCIGSACGASGCVGSICVGSGCGMSGCIGSACGLSGCAGSVCVVSGCGGSVCVESGCGISVCGGTGCAGSACITTGCAGSICVESGCSLSACMTSGCGDSSCQASSCTGSVCADPCCTTLLDADVLRSLDYNSDSNHVEILIAVAHSGPEFIELLSANGHVERKPLKKGILNRIVLDGSYTMQRDSVQVRAHSISLRIEASDGGAQS